MRDDGKHAAVQVLPGRALPVSTFVYRPATDDDWPFVSSSFANEYLSSTMLPVADFKHHIMPMFARQYRAGRTVVAFPQSEPTEIAGWIAFRPDALVFGVVKRSYRGLGVWRGLRDLVANLNSRETYPCIFKPDRFHDPKFKAAPWMALT